tara:strand:+ start:247 stop:423 length:177 start_codon:yes stop_codon:yes gene_type:complete
MTNWGQWYNGYSDEDIVFVNEIVKFLQDKLDKSKEEETIKKKRLSIQIESLKYMYNLD